VNEASPKVYVTVVESFHNPKAPTEGVNYHDPTEPLISTLWTIASADKVVYFVAPD